MPFPVDVEFVNAAERRLGVVFPHSFRAAMVKSNGGTVKSAGEAWELHPFRDESDHKRLARTCNDIERETKSRQEWSGFPRDAIEIGTNGLGDALIFLRSSSEPGRLDSIVYWWDHETGELNQLAHDFGELLSTSDSRVDPELSKRLNLLRSSPNFVMQEFGDRGEAKVFSIARVPPSSGIFWISGICRLRGGRELESVFRVDTDSGGTLLGTYWWIEGRWVEQNGRDTSALGLPAEEVFPYDWAFAVPLTEDIYHD